MHFVGQTLDPPRSCSWILAQAATLVEGLPEVDTAVIKQGLIVEVGRQVGGATGSKVSGAVTKAAAAGGSIASMVLGVANVSLIARAVKGRRMKKSAKSVEVMMGEYAAVQAQLSAEMGRRGMACRRTALHLGLGVGSIPSSSLLTNELVQRDLLHGHILRVQHECTMAWCGRIK